MFGLGFLRFRERPAEFPSTSEPPKPPPSPCRGEAKAALRAMDKAPNIDQANQIGDKYLGRIAAHPHCTKVEQGLAGFYESYAQMGPLSANTIAATLRATLAVLAAGVSGPLGNAQFDVLNKVLSGPGKSRMLAEMAARNENVWRKGATPRSTAQAPGGGPAAATARPAPVVAIPSTDVEVFFGPTGPSDVYARAVADSGAIPRQIYADAGSAQAQMEKADAVLLPGGADIDPRLYGERKSFDVQFSSAGIEFDRFEADATKYAFKYEIPMLGICRGLQMMNVAGDGGLIQDISRYHKSPDRRRESHRVADYKVAHPLVIMPKTHLRELMGSADMDVNSNHHQCIDPQRVSRLLQISAWSTDHVIEGAERPGGIFQVGVQYHPEQARAKDPRQQRLFDALASHGAQYNAHKTEIRARIDKPPAAPSHA